MTTSIHLSFGLNPLGCNGVVYKYNNVIYAEPADSCHSDTVSYADDYSYMYYCNGNSIYRKRWYPDGSCSGSPLSPDEKMSDIVAADPNFSSTYIEECGLNECEYAYIKSYYSSQPTNCSEWIPTPSDSYWTDEFYIRNYCFDYGTYSEQFACTAVKNGAVAKYEFYGVTDCSGKGNLSTLQFIGKNQCIVYTDSQGQYVQKQDILCNVSTPSPTPQWTQPVTELPCNAVEFEFSGGTVSYPVDVCIHDQISQQSVMFYCDNTTDILKFKSWDSSAECVGESQHNGSSFQDYIEQQNVLVRSQFGAYSTVCNKTACDYVIVKDYEYTGECDQFTPTPSTTYKETYFIRDYCLKIDDGTDKGSLAWGCDLDNNHATWISYDGITDCSDGYKAHISWVDLGNGAECLSGTEGINYVDVTCYSPTEKPTSNPTQITNAPTSIPSSSPITAKPTQSTPSPTTLTESPSQTPTEITVAPTQTTDAPTQTTDGPTQATDAPTTNTKAPTGSTEEVTIPGCVPGGYTYIGNDVECTVAGYKCAEGWEKWDINGCGCGCKQDDEGPTGNKASWRLYVHGYFIVFVVCIFLAF